MLNVGDIVEILKEYQDPGDDEFVWVVVGPVEKGRVDISASNSTLAVRPVYTVPVEWVVRKPGS